MPACNRAEAEEDVLNYDGIHCSGSGFGSRKRKNKEQLQLFMNEKDYRMRLQEILYTPEFIFTKIFRKDGPPLGDQFDSLPSNASRKSHYDSVRHAHNKRRKASDHVILDYETCENNSPAPRHGIGKGPMSAKDVPFKKHGMGKGLMTQKGATGKKHGIGKGLMMFCPYDGKTATQKKKKRAQPRESIMRKLASREQAKRKASLRRRKVECQKVHMQNEPHKGICKLALEDARCLEYRQNTTMLVEDEELELRELQAGPNPLSSCSHFPTKGSHSCSLCKDLLAKFPPHSVTMRLPLSAQPWASLPGLVNKLFK